MSYSNVTYNATAKGTQIVLLPPAAAAAAFGLTPILFSGAGRNKWFEINQPQDSTVAEVACDGGLIVHGAPAGNLLKGILTFNPGSATLVALANLQTLQLNNNIVLANTLLVENPTTGTSIKYENFILASVFKGFAFGQQIEDYDIPFYCVPPNYIDLTYLISLITNL